MFLLKSQLVLLCPVFELGLVNQLVLMLGLVFLLVLLFLLARVLLGCLLGRISVLVGIVV